MKKSIISGLLILAMIFTIAAFASCANNEEVEEKITVNVKITTSAGALLGQNDLVLTKGVEDFTVLGASQKMCVVVLEEQFVYDENLNAVVQIGADISELVAKEDDDPADAPAEGEDETEVAVKDFYYDWVCTVNGNEAIPTDAIKNGDKIEWTWKEVKKELQEKKK